METRIMSENPHQINDRHPLEGAKVISSYTRDQAVEDGILVEVPEKLWREAGFRWPVAVTHHVYADVAEVPEHPNAAGQSVEGRLWDVLTMAGSVLRARKRQACIAGLEPDDRICQFEVLATDEDGAQALHRLWIVMSEEGAGGAPTLTIMFPEDY
jgi:hypothetical protein